MVHEHLGHIALVVLPLLAALVYRLIVSRRRRVLVAALPLLIAAGALIHIVPDQTIICCATSSSSSLPMCCTQAHATVALDFSAVPTALVLVGSVAPLVPTPPITDIPAPYLIRGPPVG